ncbi:hypothetical protein K2X85_16230 [bacterium]|nr:hypothetical protein [bacterium]
MIEFSPKERFMRLAIEKAREARAAGDYAIGAVVVIGDVILAASGNRVKLDHDPTQHADPDFPDEFLSRPVLGPEVRVKSRS